MLDPDLRSASMVEYAHARRAHQRAAHHDDRRASRQRAGPRRHVRRSATTSSSLQPARRVRFGMMVKTTTGVELGGGTYPEAGSRRPTSSPRARACTVRFAFRCQLFAGMYFLNTGLMGEVDGTDTYLHRLVDAVAFRVQPDASRKQSGYVDFAVTASR